MNISEICKRLQAEGKGHLIWSREKGRDIVSNRHFLLKFDELPRQVLVTLFSIYLRVPQIGETIIMQRGEEVKSTIDFNKVYTPDKQSEMGNITNFIYEIDRKLSLRAVKIGKHFAYVNNSYAKMAAVDCWVLSTDGKYAPIYFRHEIGDLMILPYRVGPDEGVIIELEAIINDQLK